MPPPPGAPQAVRGPGQGPPCHLAPHSVSPSERREKLCLNWKELVRLLQHSALRIRDNEMENPNGQNA